MTLVFYICSVCCTSGKYVMMIVMMMMVVVVMVSVEAILNVKKVETVLALRAPSRNPTLELTGLPILASWWGGAPCPPQESHPTLGLRPRFSTHFIPVNALATG